LPFNPQFSPFTAYYLTYPYWHAILSRVCHLPAAPIPIFPVTRLSPSWPILYFPPSIPFLFNRLQNAPPATPLF
jgi:hypothetical protein